MSQVTQIKNEAIACADACEAPEFRGLVKRKDVQAQLDKIVEQISFYNKQLKEHPIVGLLNNGSVPNSILIDFAAIQYADSLFWIPMLALLKDKATSPRLKKALRANLLCEAGAYATSHVEICRQFIVSNGINLDEIDFGTVAGAQAIRSVQVADLNEGQIAGWILAAETLVPLQFKLFRDAFSRVEGVDLKYLDEHIVVDSDEHSLWMLESCADLINELDCLDDILSGIDIGGRVQLRDPDALYHKTLRTLNGRRNKKQSEKAEECIGLPVSSSTNEAKICA